MVKIIGQSDCTAFIAHCLQCYGVNNIEDFNDIKYFRENFSLVVNKVKEKEQVRLDNTINELKLRESSLINTLDNKKRLTCTITKIKINKNKKRYGLFE